MSTATPQQQRTRGLRHSPRSSYTLDKWCRASPPPQEIRNIMWISECVAQDQKGRIADGIVYLF